MRRSLAHVDLTSGSSRTLLSPQRAGSGIAYHSGEPWRNHVDRVTLDDALAAGRTELATQVLVSDETRQGRHALGRRGHAESGDAMNDDVRIHADARRYDGDSRGHVEQSLVASLTSSPRVVRLRKYADIE